MNQMSFRSLLGFFISLLGFSSTIVASAQGAGDTGSSRALPGIASAAQGSSANTELEVGSYCRYVQAVGESNSALLFSPTLFATFSNIPTSATGADSNVFGASRARLQLGVSVSPMRIYRGLITNDVARAECRRYASEVRTPPVALAPITGRTALVAKMHVLEDAIAHGQVVRAKLRVRLETSLATVDEYGALVLQLDGLQDELSQAAAKLAQLPLGPTPNAPGSLAERAAAEDAAQDAQARLRRSQALEFELRAGYYRIFGQEQKVPLFAIASLEFSPGWLWQGSTEARAREAHSSWVRARLAPPAPPPEVQAQLREALSANRKRANELVLTMSDLEMRRKTAEAVPGEQAQHFAEVMWLQLARLRANRAYLDEYGIELQAAISRLSSGAR